MYKNHNITVVIPAYNEETFIGPVLETIPAYVDHIIVVDDCSTDHTFRQAQASGDPRCIVVQTPRNSGVGGAMLYGYRRALKFDTHIIVKIDGDGQMPVEYLRNLIEPLINGAADYAKGNRFRDFRALRQMPLPRKIGNMLLSFSAKAVTGYWNCFDPTNGFLAIRREVLLQLPLDHIDPSYFFEHSMLSQLYLIDAVVQDVPMPTRYGAEISTLSIRKVLLTFPGKLCRCLVRRIVFKKFIYDFTMDAIYLLFSLPMIAFAVGYGGYNWWQYGRMQVSAPTGTVVIPAMLIILGVQLLLAAIQMDLHAVPQQPIHQTPARWLEPAERPPDCSPQEHQS